MYKPRGKPFEKGHKFLGDLSKPNYFKKGMVSLRKGVKLSEETKKKIGLANRKEPSPVIKKVKKRRKFNKKYKNAYEKIRLRKNLEKLAGRERSDQCEICGSMGRICYDHNHETGKFRGWICYRCNLTLGLVKDNTNLLELMIKYLN